MGALRQFRDESSKTYKCGIEIPYDTSEPFVKVLRRMGWTFLTKKVGDKMEVHLETESHLTEALEILGRIESGETIENDSPVNG